MKTPPQPAPSAVDLAASVAARVARLTAALGDPFHEDPRLAHYLVALEQADAAAKSAPARAPDAQFLARADAYLAAHEIALAVMAGRHAAPSWAMFTHRALALFDVELIRRGHVRTVTALKSLEPGLFTAWNEEPAAQTRAFWEAVKLAGLPYERRVRKGRR